MPMSYRLARMKSEAKTKRKEREQAERMKCQQKEMRKAALATQFKEWTADVNGRIPVALVTRLLFGNALLWSFQRGGRASCDGAVCRGEGSLQWRVGNDYDSECRLVSDSSPSPESTQKGCSAFSAGVARCTFRYRAASLALLWAQLHLLSSPITHTDQHRSS